MPAIANYKVGVTRSHKPGPARWITLKLASVSDGASAVSLFFYEKEPPLFGFLNRESATLVVNFRGEDFEPMYRILNTESPVFAHFRVHGDEHRLLSFALSTSEEPLGEGPVDHSP